MRGRFYLDARTEELESEQGLSSLPTLELRYNIAPSQPLLAVVATEASRAGHWYRWGLIPAMTGPTPLPPLD